MNQLSDKIEAVFPLSPTQAGMLYHSISSPGSATYIGQHRIRLRNVNRSALRAALQKVINRHSALRTAFVWEGLSQSVQLVYAEWDVPLEELDFSGSEQELDAYCEAERRIEFDFDKQPPSRFKLLRLNDSESELLWTRHHVMVDGWSAHAVLRELSAAYTAVLGNEHWDAVPADGFACYIAWLQQQDTGKSSGYWQALLSSSPASSDIENIRSSNRGAHHTEQIELILDEDFSDHLRVSCRETGITLSAAMHGAWAAVLAALNAGTTLVFGSTVSGRPAGLPNAEHIVGNFINTLPVVIDTHAEMTLGECLKALQLQIAQSSEHSHIPHRDIVNNASIEPGAALFESIVVFMNYPKLTQDHSALDIAYHQYKEHSHYPLAVLIVPNDAIGIILIHDKGLIEPFKARQLTKLFEQNLRNLVSQLKKPAEDYFKGARTHRSTLKTTPLIVPPTDVVSRMSETARLHPTRCALNDGELSLSYADLDNAAANLAVQLRDNGVKSGDRVLIRMPRSLQGLVAIWGVLYAGASYVPCNPEESALRLRELMSATGARCLVSSEVLSDFPDALVFTHIDLSSRVFQPIVPEPDSLAYIIFTSGSTGQAKQVPVSHSNLAHSLAARLQYYDHTPRVYALLSPLAFDSSVAGIFWMAATAGELLLLSEKDMSQPNQLVNTLLNNRADSLLCLPSVYTALISAWPDDSRHSLQLAIVAGEACPATVLQQHRSLFPKATLVNEYGPTEASVWCCAQRFSPGDNTGATSDYLAIGHAIPGVSLTVRNEHGVVPAGTVGELCVSGHTVVNRVIESGTHYATGDLVEQLQDGSLLFRGRLDAQIKIRGHRVDPTDIEARLIQHPKVEDCAVIAVSNPSNATMDEIEQAMALLSPVEANELLHFVENTNATT